MIQDLGRTIIIFGVILIAIGIIFSTFGKIPFFGKLPGDIMVKRDNFTFYAPIATSILVSIILTVIINLFLRIKR